MFLFVTEIFWVFIQTRRQDFPAGGPKKHKRGNIFNYNIGCMQQPGAKYDMGTHIWNGGRAPLAPSGDGPVFIVRIRVYFGV